MTTGREELLELLEALCDGEITAAEHDRLQSRLAADAAARQLYFDYVDLRLLLRQWQRASSGEQRSAVADEPDAVPLPPVVIQTSPVFHVPTTTFFSPLGSFVFSYAAAAVIVGVGLLVGWAHQVSIPRLDRREIVGAGQQPVPTNFHPEPDVVFVGRVTGLFDCQWADSKTGTILYAYVPSGRRYALASGLMEITYDSGARVILQGPCTYQVQSRTSGYLSLGQLMARVEKKEEGGTRKGEDNRKVPIGTQQARIENPSSPSPTSRFVVHTPTAIVTDLSTEFGVKVEKSGASQAYVFRGKVEIRVAGGDNSQAVPLVTNESARVELGKNGTAAVVREIGAKNTFVCTMPRSIPMTLFNTGVGLKEGDADPRWQIISRSDDPKFKPRPSRVRVAGNAALENDPARSQWISLVGQDVDLPEDVTYVFRTTFDLSGMLPSTAVLRGKCIADDRVTAIRLNGRRLTLPLQPDGEPFIYWTEFRATTGFVKGINVLEVDVLNAGPFTPPSQRRLSKSRMSCRVELEGEVCRDPGLGGDDSSGKAPPLVGDKEKTPLKSTDTMKISSQHISSDETNGAKANPSHFPQ
jgi:hypothetical protein